MGKTSRVVVCGMAGVGKTAILEQLIYGNITPSTVSIKLKKCKSFENVMYVSSSLFFIGVTLLIFNFVNYRSCIQLLKIFM